MQGKIKNKGLKDLIIKKYPELPRQEKKVADYLIKSKPTILVFSVKELAENTGVSEATIVRFAQHLGFKGFQHLKSRMIEEAKEMIMPEDRFKFMTREKNHISTVMRVAKLEVENINSTINNLDPEQLRDFIDRLWNSQYVYTIGIGISALMARVAAYLFNQAGIKSYAFMKEEHSFLERLVNIEKKDVVLSFSFPPYSKETIEAMKFCFERKISSLAITDKPTAPIVKWVQAHLVIRTDNLLFTNAVSAIVVVLNALSTELALFNKEKVADKSKYVFEAVKEEFLI
ncbi:MAG: MurR/RpiR family transcriptional regulator [Acidobacteriota bacterium]